MGSRYEKTGRGAVLDYMMQNPQRINKSGEKKKEKSFFGILVAEGQESVMVDHMAANGRH